MTKDGIRIELWGGPRDGEIVELPGQMTEFKCIRIGPPQALGSEGTYELTGLYRHGAIVYKLVKGVYE